MSTDASKYPGYGSTRETSTNPSPDKVEETEMTEGQKKILRKDQQRADTRARIAATATQADSDFNNACTVYQASGKDEEDWKVFAQAFKTYAEKRTEASVTGEKFEDQVQYNANN